MWIYVSLIIIIVVVTWIIYIRFSYYSNEDKWNKWAKGPVVNFLSGTRFRKDKSQNWNLCCDTFHVIGHKHIHNTSKCSLNLGQPIEDTKIHLLNCPRFWKANPNKTKEQFLNTYPN